MEKVRKLLCVRPLRRAGLCAEGTVQHRRIRGGVCEYGEKTIQQNGIYSFATKAPALNDQIGNDSLDTFEGRPARLEIPTAAWGRPYVVDFFCPALKLAIEVDGISHESAQQSIRDNNRQGFLESQGIQVLRFNTEEIMRELDRVVENVY